MKNSVSDYVASAMDAALKSDEYKSMFRTSYKYASVDEVDSDDAKDKKCKECHEKSCVCDSAKADDVASASDSLDVDSSDADFDLANVEDEGEELSSAAYDIAFDSLLTASAALDSIGGFEKSAEFSLRLAALVTEAKKKEVDSKAKDKAAAEKLKAKEKKEKDLQLAKDKKEKEKLKLEKLKEKEKKDLAMAKDRAMKEKDKEKLAKQKELEKASKK